MCRSCRIGQSHRKQIENEWQQLGQAIFLPLKSIEDKKLRASARCQIP